jgi:predicted component of type VI protein secretion system
MKLTLVLKGPDRLMGAQLEKSMQNGSLVIGRSPNADWTLPDPERVVSKAHCRIDKDYSGFVLTDTSTNGVEINDDPVGFGLPRRLSDRDVLKLGDAVVVVRIEDEAQALLSNGPTRQPPRVERANIPAGPFGLPDKATEMQRADFPALTPGDAGTKPSDQILDDWWAPTAAVSHPISVDISPKESPEAIRNAIVVGDSPPLRNGGVTNLAVSLTGIDIAAFAQAVDAAADMLPENEKFRFYERLRGLLHGSQSRGR